MMGRKEDDKSEGAVFFGGIPTDIEVAKLEEAFGTPDEGVVLNYEDIDGVLGMSRDEARWRSVVGAWRKKLLREKNLTSRGVRNEGILFHNASQRVDHLKGRARQEVRRLVETNRLADTTPTKDLEMHERRSLDGVSRLTAAMIHVGRQEEKAWRRAVKQPERLFKCVSESGSEE